MAQALALSEANVENLEGHRPESQLWVDRYRPQKYADLLGDDVSERSTVTLAISHSLIIVSLSLSAYIEML